VNTRINNLNSRSVYGFKRRSMCKLQNGTTADLVKETADRADG